MEFKEFACKEHAWNKGMCKDASSNRQRGEVMLQVAIYKGPQPTRKLAGGKFKCTPNFFSQSCIPCAMHRSQQSRRLSVGVDVSAERQYVNETTMLNAMMYLSCARASMLSTCCLMRGRGSVSPLRTISSRSAVRMYSRSS